MKTGTTLKPILMIALLFGILFSPKAWSNSKFNKPNPQLLEKGKAAFTANCALCHGDKGDGNGPAGASMNPKPRDFAIGKFKKGDKPDQLFKTISEGLSGTAMPGFAHLPEEDRWGIAHYIKSFKKKK